MFKNTAGKFIVFAFDSATNLPKTGDAANLTAYVSKDFGTVTVLADTSATEMDATNAKGFYLFDAAQGETNGDMLLVSGKSSTAGIVVVGAPSTITTLPTTGILSPATLGRTLVVDAAGLADATAVKVGPTGAATAQTARDVGASVLLSAGTGTGQVTLASGVLKANPDYTTVTLPAGAIPALGWVDNGTAQTGSTANTFKLRSAASFADNELRGHTIVTTGGTGAGQSRSVDSNVGSTDVCTVSPPWDTTPDGTTTYAVYGTPPSNSGSPIRTGIAAAGASTTLTLDSGASAVDGFYNNDLVAITSGTGAGQARFFTAYVGSTKVGTVAAWKTNPDSTSGFAIIPFDAVAGATAPTAAQIATAIFTDLLSSSDFSTSASFGKLLKDNIDAAITSRMATFTQPTGFLAATFPATVGSATLAGDLSATMKASVTTAASSATPVATVSGDLSATMKASVTTAASAATPVATVSGDLSATMKTSVAAAVLDATAASHNTAGTTGAKINAAASAGDPLTSTVPGSYGAGTAGAAIAAAAAGGGGGGNPLVWGQ